MKNFIKKAVFLVGIFSFIISICGCNKSSDTVKSEIDFSKFSQQERISYVDQFLISNYNIDCDIAEVKKKQVTAVKNDEHYFTTAITPNGEIISVWVTNSGQITDSYFLVESADDLSDHFTNIISNVLPDCKVKITTEMTDIPTRKLMPGENIQEYLNTQPTHTYIRIFVSDDLIVNESDINKLQNALSYCNASLYVYLCNNLVSVDVNNYDYSTYSFMRNIRKD